MIFTFYAPRRTSEPGVSEIPREQRYAEASATEVISDSSARWSMPSKAADTVGSVCKPKVRVWSVKVGPRVEKGWPMHGVGDEKRRPQ